MIKIKLQNVNIGPGVMEHASNPSTAEAVRWIPSSRPAWATQTLPQKNKNKQKSKHGKDITDFFLFTLFRILYMK
jgi:hypothetical protein